MNKDSSLDITRETARLLEQLDYAIDCSSMLRAIMRRREQLIDLERLTGPSRETRRMRQEIGQMERKLEVARQRAPGHIPLPSV